MYKELDLVLLPEEAYYPESLLKLVHKKLQVSPGDKVEIVPLRRSIDARSKQVKINLQVAVYVNESLPERTSFRKDYQNVQKALQVIIVGAGPAGLFAALRLIELGIKPVVLERGKDVRSRRRDLAAINKDHVVNPDSNYCFGEGGAGTYSDGKLYTRSKKRGDVRRILEILVAHGATEEILIDSHPHIGTNKLPKIIEEMRHSIIHAGGEIHFETKVSGFIIRDDEMKGVITARGDKVEGSGVILATGHSARDIFEMLHQQGILIEAKPFALGVRIEHQQSLIDSIQYHCENRSPFLPASSYSLVNQVNFNGISRGVFSFCMCPGGFIVPAATAPGEIVVNGMSPSRRDSKYANSGMVVAVETEDIDKKYLKFGALANLAFQKEIEQKACALAGGRQTAPAQKMADFVNRRVSASLLPTSYQPGLTSVEMREVLPSFIAHRLQEGFKYFGKKMRGYLTNEAQIVGVESRTSSPVKIPRNSETLEHVQIKRLYPCGEGAGFAGGIVSAAMDGERCAEMLVNKYIIK